MASLRGGRSGFLMQQIGRLFLEGTSIGLTEGELLDRFVRGRDETAFEALMARHGPMVLGVCRQLLRDPNDVDDAFQATFLVLVRKAGTLRRCDLLGNWLYGVAYRVAIRARSLSARRMARFGADARGASLADAEDRQGSGLCPANLMELELRPWLHQEVSHLPAKYRAPIVLCYFEGLTHDEAASRLGCPLGTVKGRLSRARELLRRRLTRRGVALSATALASQLPIADAQGAVSAALEMTTLRAALSIASHASVSLARASSISIPITALAEGVLQTMMWNQVRGTAASLILAGTIATGVVVGATQLSGGGDGGAETGEALPSSGPLIAQRGGGSVTKSGGPIAKLAGAAADDSKKSGSPDLLSQLSETNRSFDKMLARLRDPGIPEIDRLSTWSNLMLSADLVLAATREDGAAARGAHRDRMKKLHELLKKMPAATKKQTVNANHAEEKLREAEFLLEKGGTPPPGPGMMAGMMGQMRGMMGGMSQPTKSSDAMQSHGRSAPGSAGSASPGGGSAPAGEPGLGGAAGGGGFGGGGAGGFGGEQGGAGGAGMGTGGMMGRMSGMSGGMGMGGGMVGGMGGMSGVMGGPGHRRSLSLALVSTAMELAIRDKNPKSKVVHKKLDEPISMSFNEETPLEDVLKYIRVATTTKTCGGIPIYVDPSGLKEAGKSMRSTVSNLDLEWIPLKTTLRLLLKQMGLAYCVRDGVLVISSAEGILEELKEALQELDTASEIAEPTE